MSKKIERMRHIVGIIRKGMDRYVGCFPKYFCKSEIAKQLAMIDPRIGEFPCCSKTVQRDIIELKEVYGAPIEYDSEYRGYFLLDEDYAFEPAPWPRQDIEIAYAALLFAPKVDNERSDEYDQLRLCLEESYGFSPSDVESDCLEMVVGPPELKKGA
jgi:hypothetical protein